MRREEGKKVGRWEGGRTEKKVRRGEGGEGRLTTKKKDIRHFRDLVVYEMAFAVAMRIYNESKTFPPEEKYSLVDQIRRSSRSVCSNLAEAWRKRRYSAVFKNKITDSMMEASETQCWLEFCLAHRFSRDGIDLRFQGAIET